jgi:hypothetical protein
VTRDQQIANQSEFVIYLTKISRSKNFKIIKQGGFIQVRKGGNMTHADGPKFSAKHGADAQADPKIKDKIEKKAENGEVACAAAFQVAEELKLAPVEIVKTIDVLDFKIVKCQLGLFGYAPEKKVVEPKAPENQQLEEAIRGALVDEKLACSDAWGIASRFNVSKMTVSSACEALKIKIKSCQLGAF